MAKIQELQKYLNYEFSTGCYTGEDYKSFERKYINYLKALCKERGWEFVWGHKNHYNFTACFSYCGKYAYFSISDVRFWKNEWYYHILYRSMKQKIIRAAVIVILICLISETQLQTFSTGWAYEIK